MVLFSLVKIKPHSRLFLSTLAFSTLVSLVSSASCKAEENPLLALFSGQAASADQYPAGAEDMVASYNDGRDTNAPAQESTEVARETPTTTKEIVDDPTNQKPGTITVDTKNRCDRSKKNWLLCRSWRWCGSNVRNFCSFGGARDRR